MAKPLFIILAGFAGLILGGCRKTPPALNETLALVPGLQLGLTPKQAQVVLTDRQGWVTIERTRQDATGEIPRYALEVYDTRTSSSLGKPATMRLRFFNDALFSAQLTPDSWTTYSAALSGVIGKRVLVPMVVPLSERVNLWTSDAGSTSPQVGWTDEVVENEITLWIERYS